MAIFCFFKLAAAVVLDFQNVEILAVGTVKRVQTRHCANFGAISQAVTETWRFFEFKDGAVRHLDFVKVGILTADRVERISTPHCAEFRRDCSNRS